MQPQNMLNFDTGQIRGIQPTLQNFRVHTPDTSLNHWTRKGAVTIVKMLWKEHSGNFWTPDYEGTRHSSFTATLPNTRWLASYRNYHCHRISQTVKGLWHPPVLFEGWLLFDTFCLSPHYFWEENSEYGGMEPSWWLVMIFPGQNKRSRCPSRSAETLQHVLEYSPEKGPRSGDVTHVGWTLRSNTIGTESNRTNIDCSPHIRRGLPKWFKMQNHAFNSIQHFKKKVMQQSVWNVFSHRQLSMIKVLCDFWGACIIRCKHKLNRSLLTSLGSTYWIYIDYIVLLSIGSFSMLHSCDFLFCRCGVRTVDYSFPIGLLRGGSQGEGVP